MALDDVTVVSILRIICLVIDAIGIIVGLDLVIGAPLVKFLSKILNKVIDFDKSLVNTKTRIILGFLFVIISGVMLYVTLRTR